MKHRAKNCISNLSRGRDIITNENEISREMVSYFSSLLSSHPNVDGTKQMELLEAIPQVVCSFEGDKSLGLDGFPMLFSINFGKWLVKMFVMQ